MSAATPGSFPEDILNDSVRLDSSPPEVHPARPKTPVPTGAFRTPQSKLNNARDIDLASRASTVLRASPGSPLKRIMDGRYGMATGQDGQERPRGTAEADSPVQGNGTNPQNAPRHRRESKTLDGDRVPPTSAPPASSPLEDGQLDSSAADLLAVQEEELRKRGFVTYRSEQEVIDEMPERLGNNKHTLVWLNGKTDFHVGRLTDEVCILGDRVSDLKTDIQGLKKHSVDFGASITGLLQRQTSDNVNAHQTTRDTLTKFTADTSVKFADLNAKIQQLMDKPAPTGVTTADLDQALASWSGRLEKTMQQRVTRETTVLHTTVSELDTRLSKNQLDLSTRLDGQIRLLDASLRDSTKRMWQHIQELEQQTPTEQTSVASDPRVTQLTERLRNLEAITNAYAGRRERERDDDSRHEGYREEGPGQPGDVDLGRTAEGPGDPDGGDDGDDSDNGRHGNWKRDHNGFPRNPHQNREGTHDSGITGASQTTSSVKIRREDIGMFDPSFEDPDDMGMVYDGKNVTYTDVNCFVSRIQSFLDSPETQEEASKQILNHFPTLLAGSALLWWTNQVNVERRRRWQSQGLSVVLERLTSRFAVDSALATSRYNETSLTLKEIAKDDQALEQYFARKLRWARAMRILDAQDTNWLGVMTNIWNTMELGIKQFLPQPEAHHEDIETYMRVIEGKRSIILTLARERYPQYGQKKSTTTTKKVEDTSSRQSRHDSSRNDSSHRDSSRRRSSHHDSKYYSRDRSRDRRDRDRDRSRHRDDRGDRDREYERDRYDKAKNDRHRDERRRDDDRKRDDRKRDDRDRRRRDGVHWADGQSDSGTEADRSNSESSYSSVNTEIACMVLDADLTCRKCHKSFNSKQEVRSHVRGCKGTGPLRSEKDFARNLKNISRRTCGYCSETLSTRNELFRHLKHCEDAKNGHFRRPADPGINGSGSEDSGPVDVANLVVPGIGDDEGTKPTTAYQIKEAPEPTKVRDINSPLGNYTYLRLTVKASPEAPDVEICGDPGAGRCIIGRDFLQTLEHTVEKRKGSVLGVGDRITKISELASFTLYLVGTEDGKPTLYKVTRTAWVVDKLAANLLLANEFFDAYDGVINFRDKEVDMWGMNNFKMPFSIYTHSTPCVRKVKTTRRVTLLPDEEVVMPVEYKPLPKGRSFMFNSSHAAAYNAVVSTKTPKVVVLRNTTRGIITIPKRCPIGKIEESQDSGFFACSWSAAFTALTAATALTALSSPTAASDVDPVSVAVRQAGITPINEEFNLDNRTTAIIEHNITPAVHLAQSGLSAPEPAAPTIPESVSDYVYQITQGVEATLPPLDPDIAVVEPDAAEPGQEASRGRPIVPEKQSTLGLHMEANLPEIVTSDGVHVYAADKKLAKLFVALVKQFPKLWVDNGLVKVPPDQLMRVPLVEGWQNQKVRARSYPLSRRDREVLDQVFDGLHRQGKMLWVTKATPFAHPVFVVWRPGRNGEMKGRVVIDLRSLNRVSVPDNYPLPLQSEIIAELRGKLFITAIDATAMFYQFGIHPPHRDRFTLISPRGLEQPAVCLMGYRNSPAHVQRIMDQLLRPHSSYARAFIDDIVIYSDTAEDHLRHLKTLFELFTSKNLAISPTKSYIGYPSVELLGFKVDSLGLTTTAQRVAAFRNLAFPKTLKALEQYIGATGFLRHLIPYYAQLIEPLQERKTRLLAQGRKEGKLEAGNPSKRANYCAKTVFEPTPAELLSFESVQNAICRENPTILHHFNPDKPLFLQIDGCLERGFGVMVFHLRDGYGWQPGTIIPSTQVLPVMFLSRCLTAAEMRYGPSEQEVACLVWAVRKLRTMVHSSRLPVNVLTDHASTRGIVEQTLLDTSSTDRANRRLIVASIYLSEYDLKVYHLPGRLNFVPDALSRLKAMQDPPNQAREKGEVILDSILFAYAEAHMEDDLKAKFVAGYKTDTKYKAIIADLTGDPEATADSGTFSKAGLPFVLTDGLLYNIRPDGLRALCVPHSMVKEILDSVHDEKHHFGRERMLYDLRGLAMADKTYRVKKYIKHCPTCGLNATDRQQPIGNYQPIRPADNLPMRVIAIDFILGLPKVPAKGTPWQIEGEDKDYYDTMMTVSCKASKRTLLIPGNAKYSAEDWGLALMRQLLMCDWGVPSAIISDRDSKFTSGFWRGMWKALGTKLLMTAAWHPQADGLAERKNQSVEIALRFFIFGNPLANWTDIVVSLQWHLNNGYSEPVKSSPHEQLYGFRPAGPLDALLAPTTKAADIPVLRDTLRQDAQMAMDFAAAAAKRRYDGKHRDVEFKSGDKVFLKLHHGYHLPGKPPRKLSQQRAGPFEVKRRVGRLAYELELPPNMEIHPVVSVEHLAPAPNEADPYGRDVPPPGPVLESQSSSSSDDEPGEDYELDHVVKHRVTRGKFQYLVKWKGYGHEHDVWKTEYQLRHAPKLLKEYWDKKGGKPTAKDSDDDEEQPPRRPGRPRKKPTATEKAEDQAPPQGSPPTANTAPPKRPRGRPPKTKNTPAGVPASAPVAPEPAATTQGLRRSRRIAKEGN